VLPGRRGEEGLIPGLGASPIYGMRLAGDVGEQWRASPHKMPTRSCERHALHVIVDSSTPDRVRTYHFLVPTYPRIFLGNTNFPTSSCCHLLHHLISDHM